MKNKVIIALFMLASTLSLLGKDSNSLAVPLRIEPASVYTKVRVDAQAAENRESNVYEREKQANIEGELKFLDNFSIKVGTTKSQWEKSGSKTLTQVDRLNIGLKYANTSSFSGGSFVWGGGVRWFDRQSKKFAREDIAPELYLVRPNISLGLRLGSFEVVTDFQFQTETNRAFKENSQEEFRRYSQAGMAISYGLTDNFRLFAETEYRKPYSEKVDTKTKFWNVYPGASYKIYDSGFLSASLQFPVIQERLMDRGVRISYFHIFDY